jgi:Leu/Phe-tRNA-protein transferase
MAKRGLKFIVVEEGTKASFDAVVSQIMQTCDKDTKVTQDYVQRQIIAAYLQLMDQRKNEAEHASSN